MAYPPIQAVPQPPLLSDSEDQFDSKAVKFNLALPPLADQINAMGSWMESIAAEVSTNADAAAQSAQSASDDAAQTAADRVQTGEDATSASQSSQSASDDAAQTAADRIQTGEDRAATAQDRQLAETAREEAQAISETGLPPQDGNSGRVLGTDGTSTSWVENGLGESDVNALIADSKLLSIENITGSTLWSKDPDARLVFVSIVAPGGSGALIDQSDDFGVTGASGGQCVELLIPANQLPETLEVVIGTPGAAKTSRGFGDDGGDTTFGEILIAYGGRRGVFNADKPILANHAGASSGRSELASNSLYAFGPHCIPNTNTSHGGCNTITALSHGGDSIKGGAGSGGITSSGYVGRAGVSLRAGNAGESNSEVGVAAGDGEFPGGAGGSSKNGGRSGAGGGSVVRIWQWS